MKECGGRREEGRGRRVVGEGREGGRIEEGEGRRAVIHGGARRAEVLPQDFQSSRGSAPYLEMGFTALS